MAKIASTGSEAACAGIRPELRLYRIVTIPFDVAIFGAHSVRQRSRLATEC